MLIAMAGLPASGKSALARAISDRLKYPVIAVDSIEAAMWRSGIGGPTRPEVPTGVSSFVIAEALAQDILRLGIGVIIDAVNDSEPARRRWVELAARHGYALRFVEVVCSDPELHRRRLETRVRDIDGYIEPSWQDVLNRRYEPFAGRHLTVDTAGPVDPDAVIASLMSSPRPASAAAPQAPAPRPPSPAAPPPPVPTPPAAAPPVPSAPGIPPVPPAPAGQPHLPPGPLGAPGPG